MNDSGEQLPPEPPQPPAEETTEHQGNPWERRASLGFFAALVEALKLFVTSPKEAFSQTQLKGDYLSPLLFAIIMVWIGALVSQVWSLMFGASVMSMLPGEVQRSMGAYLTGSSLGFFATAVLAPLFAVIMVFVWAMILHLCLVIVGGLETSNAGFEGSLRVVSYGSVAQLANLLPMVGSAVGFFWSIALFVIGLQEIHGTSQGKAIAAVLIPMILCCVCVVLAMLVAGASLFSFFASQ